VGRVGDASAADEEDGDLDNLPLAVQSDHVLVHVLDGHDALLLPDGLDRPKLIAVGGGELELECLRGGLHARLELAAELVVPAIEEEPDGPDLVLVPLLVDVIDAGSEAAANLILQARPLAGRELQVGAGA